MREIFSYREGITGIPVEECIIPLQEIVPSPGPVQEQILFHDA